MSSGPKICSSCGAKLESPGKFCPNCGAKLEPEGRFCPKCEAKLEPQDKFCPNCGTTLEPQEKFCPKCEAKLEPQDKFCPKCGTKVAFSVSTVPYKAQPVVQRADTFEKNLKIRNLRILLLVSGLMPFAGWGLGIYYFTKGMRDLAAYYLGLGILTFTVGICFALGSWLQNFWLAVLPPFIFAIAYAVKGWIEIGKLVDAGKA
jgi:RNA polymerase subunit RPABC4/transcription elongation factor Spt4